MPRLAIPRPTTPGLPLVAALIAASAASAAAQGCLTTTFSFNSGGANGGAVYFDLDVLVQNGITITDLELNLAVSQLGQCFAVDVYTAPTTAIGNQTNAAAWTLVSSGTGTVQQWTGPTPADVSDFALARGSHGIAVVVNGAAQRYAFGSGSNQVYSTAELQLAAGSASNIPFTPATFAPRVWNGTICYDEPAECVLLFGLEQLNLTIGDDTILVDPMQILPMELGNTPAIPIPQDPGYLGLPIYVQTALYNPEIYPEDPLKLSRGLRFTIGVSTDHYGPINQLVMWPSGSIVAQPGGAIEIGFAIP